MNIIKYTKETDTVSLMPDAETDAKIFAMTQDIYNSVQSKAGNEDPKAKKIAGDGYLSATSIEQSFRMGPTDETQVPAADVMNLCHMLHFFANDHTGRFLSGAGFNRKFAREVSEKLYDTYLKLSGSDSKRSAKQALQAEVQALRS